MAWFTITAVHGPFGHRSSHEKVQKARSGSDRAGPRMSPSLTVVGARRQTLGVSGLQLTVVSDVESCVSRH